MKMKSKGYTLAEMMVAVAIMGIMSVGFASLVKYSTQATVRSETQGEAQEDVRQGLAKIEQMLAHANEITTASSTLVEFICDIDQSPAYNPDGDLDGDGIPDYRDGDRDNDVMLLLPATAQWRSGYNLKDDDEDGDGKIDVRKRIYLSGRDIMSDTSINEEPWGGRITRLLPNVSTFTLSYYGNKANNLGKNIDQNGDGIITSYEMDYVLPPSGMGNRNGTLDLKNERRYITSVRLYVGADRNRDGKTEYAIETDVYPVLLPLKSQ